MRTIDDVLAECDVILSGRTRHAGQEPRDDELMVAEIKRLRGQVVALRDAAREFWAANEAAADMTGIDTATVARWERAEAALVALAGTAPEGGE